MPTASPFREARSYTPEAILVYHETELPERFSTRAQELEAARKRPFLVDRSDRGLLTLTGAQRLEWLHNLVTNAIKPLEPGRGCYNFATSAKGRILFDLNALALPDVLWLDLDLPAVPRAATHFDRYLFTEDVKITDVTGEYARLGFGGTQVTSILDGLRIGAATVWPQLGHAILPESDARVVRHDFAGLPGFELIVPRGQAANWWDRLTDAGARPVGFRTLDVLRLEAGLPWPGRDLDETVLPPETGQAERAVNHYKGCYLGHEVIERMRSRDALARRLVQLRMAEPPATDLPVPLRQGSRHVGRITSLVHHPLDSDWIGLGYLQTSVTGYAELIAGDPPLSVTILSA